MEQTIKNITLDNQEVKVTFSPCDHTCMWLPLPQYTAEGTVEVLKGLVGRPMQCPSCVALAFVESQGRGVLAGIGWFEDKLEARVYTEGRIIRIESKTPHAWELQDGYTGKDKKIIVTNAKIRIWEFYPDATIMLDSELDDQIKKDGYRYPASYDLDTPFLCECGKPLFLEPSSRGAGRNTPYGNPWHTWYECKACTRAYVCMSQEFMDGVRDSWSVRENKESGLPFTGTSCPKRDEINTHGFYETILIMKKVNE